MIRAAILATLLSCSGNGGEEGVRLTPGRSWALHGLAPECSIRGGSGEIRQHRECTGRPGTVRIALRAAERLARLEIKLVSMTLPQAKAHLVPALTPVLGSATCDAVERELDGMTLGDAATLRAAGARIELTAAGTSRLAPEYHVVITWP